MKTRGLCACHVNTERFETEPAICSVIVALDNNPSLRCILLCGLCFTSICAVPLMSLVQIGHPCNGPTLFLFMATFLILESILC